MYCRKTGGIQAFLHSLRLVAGKTMVLQPVSSVLNGFVQQHVWLDASDELEKILRALRSIEAVMACPQLIKEDKHLFRAIRLPLQAVQSITHEVLDLLHEWQHLRRRDSKLSCWASFKKKREQFLFLAAFRRRAQPAFED